MSFSEYPVGHLPWVNIGSTPIRESANLRDLRKFSDNNKIQVEVTKFVVSPNNLKLSSSFLNGLWVGEEIIKHECYLELNGNENATYENLWNAAEALFRGICVNQFEKVLFEKEKFLKNQWSKLIP